MTVERPTAAHDGDRRFLGGPGPLNWLVGGRRTSIAIDGGSSISTRVEVIRSSGEHPANMYAIPIAVMLALTFAHPAQARTITCGAEDIQCLVSAVADANANGRPRNTIRLAPGTYTLRDVDNDTNGPNGLPSITSTLTIEVAGSGAATLGRASGAPRFRLLHVGAGGQLTLRGATVIHGDSSEAVGSRFPGGGLFNDGGVVTIADSAFTDNNGGGLVNSGGVVTIRDSTFARNFANTGAGISNCGTLSITRSTFDRNNALEGGALLLSDGVVRIVRSRLTTNQAHFSGGAILMRGGSALITGSSLVGNFSDFVGGIDVSGQSMLTITNSAFVENSGENGAALRNGGTVEVKDSTFARNVGGRSRDAVGAILNGGGLSLINSTIAGNTTVMLNPEDVAIATTVNATTIMQNTILANADGQILQDCRGPITSLGNNLLGDPSGCTITLQPGDLTGDPGLDAFTDSGTPGNGHFPLLAASQAIGAANRDACGKKDQIGQRRGRRCDIGAIEFIPVPFTKKNDEELALSAK
jgi:hypothetical protein